VADLKTAITEVVTGLGMCGDDDVGVALKVRPDALENVSDDEFGRLGDAWNDGQHRDLFVASFMNGQAFLRARDALRGRPPVLVEWKGPHRSVGDEAVPADLRVDHVYLVSCKYLSRIVVNASPEHLFDRVLKGGHGQRTGSNWFHQVAPAEHAALYASVRDSVDPALPADVNALTAAQRHAIARRCSALNAVTSAGSVGSTAARTRPYSAACSSGAISWNQLPALRRPWPPLSTRSNRCSGEALTTMRDRYLQLTR